MKVGRLTRPPITARGYSSRVAAIITTETTTTYWASTPAASRPTRAPTTRARANTPKGASHSTP
jgi:hypothetical protein